MAEDIKLAFEFMLYNSSFPTIGALIKQNIAEKLQNGPQTAEELSESTSINPSRLFRYLRISSYFGIFTLDPSTQRWSNTSKSLALTSKFSHCFWGWETDPYILEKYTHTLPLLTSNKSVSELLGRPPMFEEIKEKPELLESFQALMSQTTGQSLFVLESLDIGDSKSVLDVGGADGSLVLEIVKKHQDIKGGVLDRSEIAGLALGKISSQGLAERVQFHAGNFMESVPSGYDCHVLKHITHDWPDDQVLGILKNCRKVLLPGMKLFLIGQVLDETSEFYNGVLAIDHLMMLLFNGKERTEKEFHELLQASGFRMVRIKPCGIEKIIEAEAC